MRLGAEGAARAARGAGTGRLPCAPVGVGRSAMAGEAACPREGRRCLFRVGHERGSRCSHPTTHTLFRDAASPSSKSEKKSSGIRPSGTAARRATPPTGFPPRFRVATLLFNTASNVSPMKRARKQRDAPPDTLAVGWQTAGVSSVRLGRLSCMTRDLLRSCSSVPCSSCL